MPDAKIRGKKVRVTCKHCGAGIIVDATGEPQREELRLDVLEALAPATIDASDDATRMMPKRGERSVHDEPTVIGRVPAAALEAERRYALPTVPPPKLDEAAEPVAATPPPSPSPTPSRALPYDVPEGALDVTHVASPQAKRASQLSQAEQAPRTAPLETLPEPSAPAAAIPAVAATPKSGSSLPLQPHVEVKTLLSRTERAPAPLGAARTLYWLVAGLVVLLLALALMRTMR